MTRDYELFEHIYPNNFDEIVQLLADPAVNPNVIWPGLRATSPLKIAIANGRERIALAIINHPHCDVDFDTATSTVERAIHIAVKKGNETLTRALLDKGSNLHQDCVERIYGYEILKSPLYIAAECGHIEVARLLLERGAIVDTPGGENRQSPLLVAAEKGYMPMVSLLLDYGANCHYKTEQEGYTALMLAAKRGHTDLVFWLLEAGANPYLRTNAGKNLLAVLSDALCYAEQWPDSKEINAEELRVLRHKIVKWIENNTNELESKNYFLLPEAHLMGISKDRYY